MHRDIKPQNLLLVQPPSANINSTEEKDLPILKVADFGFARFLPGANLADTLCGSPLYMGPEILSYKKYDAKADLWSVGAVLYEMVTGRPPFRAQNHIELLKKIQENNDQIHFPDERNPDIIIGSDLKDLIRKLLKKNPVERLSFEDFFHHPAVVSRPIPIQRKYNRVQSESYEPPPFATRQVVEPSRRWSYTKENTKTTWSPSEPTKKKNSGTEEDMLQEYVVLDRRIIETNQFADELDASPRKTISIPIVEKRPSSQNIPISPSTPPFVRERKTSIVSSSAGSALAKALNKASTRLFGTNIPSPPKENYIQHSHNLPPHGYMSHSNYSNRTLKHIERLACMSFAVSSFGDMKYETYVNQQKEMDGDDAVALYFKSLALLELGLNVAQQYWQNYILEEDKNQTNQLNDNVQWMRDKFNEYLKKAEFGKDKPVNASVEKLLYDRALEMVSKKI